MHPFATATTTSSNLSTLSATGYSCCTLPLVVVPGMLVKSLCSATRGGCIAGLSLTELFSFAARMLINSPRGALSTSLQRLRVYTFVAFAGMLACSGTPGCSAGQRFVSVLHPCLGIRR